RRRHTRFSRDWSSDVCSSDLAGVHRAPRGGARGGRPGLVARSLNCNAGDLYAEFARLSGPQRGCMAKEDAIQMEGRVVETLPNTDRKSVVAGKSGQHGRVRGV